MLREDPLTDSLFPIATGYFPTARDHVLKDRVSDEHLLIYCERGMGWVDVASRRHEVHAGDVLVLPAGLQHSFAAHRRVPWTIAWAHYAGSASAGVLSLLGLTAEAPVRRLGKAPEVVSGIRELTERIASTADRSSAFTMCARLITVLEACAKANRAPLQALPLRRVLKLLHDNMQADHTLSDMARVAGWSTSHLTRVFRQKMGVAPLGYLQQLRVQRAAQMLIIEAKLPISEVALRVGYPDAYYFSRIFRKSMGLAPREYRQAHLGR